MGKTVLDAKVDDGRSIFEVVLTPIRKFLSMDNNTNLVSDNVEAGIDLMEVLYQLMAVQSKEQWLRFSLQVQGSQSNRPPKLGGLCLRF
jgi:hypothetical protein